MLVNSCPFDKIEILLNIGKTKVREMKLRSGSTLSKPSDLWPTGTEGLTILQSF